MIYWILCGVGALATLAAIFYGIYCLLNNDEKERENEL